jgi:hypothetical protein
MPIFVKSLTINVRNDIGVGVSPEIKVILRRYHRSKSILQGIAIQLIIL